MKKIRQIASGVALKLVVGLVILSFVVFGVASFLSQSGDVWAIKIGDKKISYKKVQQDINNYRNNLLALIEQNPEQQSQIEQMLQSNYLQKQAVNSIIANNVQEQFAKDLKVFADESLIYQEIVKQKVFHNKEGKFDKQLFQNFLKNKQLSESMYVNDITNQVGGQIIQNSIIMASPINNNLALDLYLFNQNTLIYDLLEIKSENVAVDKEVSESEIIALYTKNPKSYQTPELRKVQYAILDKKLATQNAEISEQEIIDYYQQNQQRYQLPETRDIYHLMFDSKEKANNFISEFNKKSTENFQQNFVDLAKTISTKKLEEISIVGVAKGQILPELEKEIFSLQPNQLSFVIESKAGFHVVLLNKINAPQTLELNKVKEQINKKLLLEKQNKVFVKLLKEINDFTLISKSFDDFAKNFAVSIVDVKEKIAKNQKTHKETEMLPNFINQVFTANINQISKPIPFDENRDKFYFVLVTEITPPQQLALQDAKHLVKQDIISAKQTQELPNFVNNLTKQIAQNPSSINSLATKYQIKIQNNNSITQKDLNQLIENKQEGVLPVITLLTQLFSLPINSISKPVMFDNNAYFLAIVKDKKQNNSNTDNIAEAKKDAIDLLRYDLFSTYQNYLLKDKYPITTNKNILAIE
jgi:parvulin-like peptidyl-prolyl isomerase